MKKVFDKILGISIMLVMASVYGYVLYILLGRLGFSDSIYNLVILEPARFIVSGGFAVVIILILSVVGYISILKKIEPYFDKFLKDKKMEEFSTALKGIIAISAYLLFCIIFGLAVGAIRESYLFY